MGKIFSLFILLFLSFLAVSAQTSIQQAFFEVRAKVKDKENIPLAGMSLFFEGDKFKQTVVSDENGLFSIKLPVGKFTIKGNEAVSKNFLTFLEIFADKPNSTDFDLIIETNQACCSPTSDEKITEIVKYVFPPYPAAARATRTIGEVIVAVKINKDGIVIDAKAEFGHPLLKTPSEVAAKQFLFTKDENSIKRDGEIVFAFVLSEKNRPNLFRKPNRLEIFSGIDTLNFSSSH
ncbi:MAG: hypothetical protein AAB336_08290 [Acidobacteriota bacterium]